ncbi:MAG: DUF4173 domain-containing protein [Chloroflexi bacterium]|nr:MAG: DUF4173 domain-containing protein [Chloroflexota bacterium]
MSDSVGQLSADGRWRWDGVRWVPAGVRWDAELPAFLRIRTRSTAGGRALAAMLVVGLLADQALRSSGIGLAASLALAFSAGLLVAITPVDRLQPRLLAAAAVFFAGWLSLRASPWLVWPDLAACVLLLGTAASLSAGGSLFDLGLAEAGARLLHGVLQAGAGFLYAAPPLAHAGRRSRRLLPVARGLLIALPIGVLLAALLAGADPIFASFFQLNFDLGSLALDVFLVLAGALWMAGVLRLAASVPVDRVEPPAWRLGLVEGLTVLAVLDLVFAGFALAQAVAVTTTNYAEYARSGFFELLWASGITLLVLALFSRITAFHRRRARRAFIALAELGIVLTLLVVVVAFRRLSLYEAAYGFTMLRLYSQAFAVLIGIVFLFLAAEVAGAGRGRRWFAGAAAVAALVCLAGLNLANPETLVVNWNLDRAATSGKLDVDYLAGLSADSRPDLLAGRGRVAPGLQAQITQAVCGQPPGAPRGWQDWNLALSGAAAAGIASCSR